MSSDDPLHLEDDGVLELLRDFATRRTVRTQFLAAEELEPAGKRKRVGA